MSNELATYNNDALTVASQIDQIQKLGQTLVKSGLLPEGVRTPEAAVTLILKGRELGLPPMQAIHHIHIIKGRPTLSAELMLALMLQAGHEVWVAHTDAEKATVCGVRRGTGREQSLTFTFDEAKSAGVANNPMWNKYRSAMLRARAISAFARMFAPDTLAGASYTAEELGGQVTVTSDGQTEVITASEEPQDAEFRPAPLAEDSITSKQVQALAIALKEAGFTPERKAEGREFVAWMLGLDALDSIKDLDMHQAQTLLDTFGTGENGSYKADKGKLEQAVLEWVEAKANAAFEAGNPATAGRPARNAPEPDTEPKTTAKGMQGGKFNDGESVRFADLGN